MVVITNLDRYVPRLQNRFDRVGKFVGQVAKRRSKDLEAVIIPMFNNWGSPTGASRLYWLRKNNYPFAAWRGYPLWNTPPIGIISGELLGSMHFYLDGWTIAGGNQYTITVSNSAPHAKWVFMPGGTKKTVDRRVTDAAYVASSQLAKQTAFELLMFQRGLCLT